MATRVVPSPETLREILRYESGTGKLYWKERPREMFESDRVFKWWNGRFAGKEAFTAIQGSGYLHGKVFGVVYLAHRVAWAVHHGSWPTENIDHIDRNRSNNKLDNLRDASPHENQRNRIRYINNKSGFKGVSWKRSINRWVAQIRLDGKPKHLGCFDTPESAHGAYIEAAKRYHGEFANYG